MLRRAATRVRELGMDNIVLVHGDAHQLPIADRSVDRVNCSGGLHAFPDLPRALREIERVARPGARLTASTFAQVSADRFTAGRRLA
ncbi:MAG TPA: methyltransferase domain-containing protein [Mycobacteriales bacterium]|nr:methyltransferase domain-containing protein [Mycobacteriales bacterium]